MISALLDGPKISHHLFEKLQVKAEMVTVKVLENFQKFHQKNRIWETKQKSKKNFDYVGSSWRDKSIWQFTILQPQWFYVRPALPWHQFGQNTHHKVLNKKWKFCIENQKLDFILGVRESRTDYFILFENRFSTSSSPHKNNFIFIWTWDARIFPPTLNWFGIRSFDMFALFLFASVHNMFFYRRAFMCLLSKTSRTCSLIRSSEFLFGIVVWTGFSVFRNVFTYCRIIAWYSWTAFLKGYLVGSPLWNLTVTLLGVYFTLMLGLSSK